MNIITAVLLMNTEYLVTNTNTRDVLQVNKGPLDKLLNEIYTVLTIKGAGGCIRKPHMYQAYKLIHSADIN